MMFAFFCSVRSFDSFSAACNSSAGKVDNFANSNPGKKYYRGVINHHKTQKQ